MGGSDSADAPMFKLSSYYEENRYAVLVKAEVYELLKPIYDIYSTLSDYVSINIITDYNFGLALTYGLSQFAEQIGIYEIGLSVRAISFVRNLAFNNIGIMKIFYNDIQTIEIPAEVVEKDGEKVLTHADNA